MTYIFTCSTSALEAMPACSNLKVFNYSLQTAEQGSPYSPVHECSPMPRYPIVLKGESDWETD